jgi:hypothetical protein
MSVELKSARFIFSAEPSLLNRVDEWRRHQPDIPSRAEAVRRLLEASLDSAEARQGSTPIPSIVTGKDKV